MQRTGIHRLGRALVAGTVAIALGTLLFQPTSALGWALDIAIRGYFTFLASVLAHEAVHGHLGRGRTGHLFGRLALLPACVPYVAFRRTHVLHHAFTNDANADPDAFLKPKSWFEIPFRTVLLPHTWMSWLARRNKLSRAARIDILASYLAFIAVFFTLGATMGHLRVAVGMAGSSVLASMLSWFPFGILTHFKTLDPKQASEKLAYDFDGRALFWATLGCSMHGTHHKLPKLSWLELSPFVQKHKGLILPHRTLVSAPPSS